MLERKPRKETRTGVGHPHPSKGRGERTRNEPCLNQGTFSHRTPNSKSSPGKTHSLQQTHGISCRIGALDEEAVVENKTYKVVGSITSAKHWTKTKKLIGVHQTCGFRNLDGPSQNPCERENQINDRALNSHEVTPGWCALAQSACKEGEETPRMRSVQDSVQVKGHSPWCMLLLTRDGSKIKMKH